MSIVLKIDHILLLLLFLFNTALNSKDEKKEQKLENGMATIKYSLHF